MPRRILDRLAPAAVLVALAAGLGGCGDEHSTADHPADTTTDDEPTTEPTDDNGGDGNGGDDRAVELEIDIEAGRVTPTAEQVGASVGDTIEVEVDSDAADELHVHTAPEEQEFAVKARDDQQFTFTVEQPGQFDVELHESDTLVAQLVVRP